MNKNRFVLASFSLLALFSISFFSCQQKSKENPSDEFDDKKITEEAKILAEGEEYSVLVISDLFNAYPDLEIALNNLLGKTVEGLPQSEPLFKLIFKHPSQINYNDKLNLCVLILNADSHSQETTDFVKSHLALENQENDQIIFREINNPWAYPQKLFYLEAPSIETVVEQLEKEGTNILKQFEKTEKIRIKRKLYARGRNSSASNRLEKSHDINISIPKGYINIMEKVPGSNDSILLKYELEGLSWFRKNESAYSSDLLFYYAPLDKYRSASNEALLAKKDEITAGLLQGSNDGSYVLSEKKYKPPVFSKTTIAGMNATEIRGLWETVGDYMGGPFLFYAIEDTKNKRMLFVDAFVYAPKLDKKAFIKRLEVCLETLSL
jgi:hypothetical protein